MEVTCAQAGDSAERRRSLLGFGLHGFDANIDVLVRAAALLAAMAMAPVPVTATALASSVSVVLEATAMAASATASVDLHATTAATTAMRDEPIDLERLGSLLLDLGKSLLVALALLVGEAVEGICDGILCQLGHARGTGLGEAHEHLAGILLGPRALDEALRLELGDEL